MFGKVEIENEFGELINDLSESNKNGEREKRGGKG